MTHALDYQVTDFEAIPATQDNGFFSDSDSESESFHTNTDRQTLNAYHISLSLPAEVSNDDGYSSLLRAASTAVNYRIHTGDFNFTSVPGHSGHVATFHGIIPVATMELVPESQHAQFLHRLLAMWLDAMMGLQAWGVQFSMHFLSAGQWALLSLDI